MIKSTIADTGAIVGLIYEKDQWHEWASIAASLDYPFLTCEAVITEAAHLLKGAPDGQQQLLAFVEQGFLKINFSLEKEVETISALMNKYSDVPMDFADACVVRMSELNETATVFTTDSDFWIYRKNGKDEIPLIIPPR